MSFSQRPAWLFTLALIALQLTLQAQTPNAAKPGTQAQAQDYPPAHPSLTAALEQAHQQFMSRMIDAHGIVLDFVGESPSPEDCRLGRPNAIGWWSPIENGPMFTGLYLPAACQRALRSGSAQDQAAAARLMQGLLKCASLSEVQGFIGRGVGSDGHCHYPLGSDDQTHPWFLGLYAFFKSPLATPTQRQQIRAKVSTVAQALESSGWKCPCDGSFQGDFRGGYQGHLFRDAVRYLHLLRLTHAITGEAIWLQRYQQACAQAPHQAKQDRVQLCALGYGPDRSLIPNIDEHNLWIYVGCQAALSDLLALETDPAKRAAFRRGLVINAGNAMPAIEAQRRFNNDNRDVFGHADWRRGYPHWFAQRTQADAQKLAEMGDKDVLGQRKSYETRLMRNPLAAAAILAHALPHLPQTSPPPSDRATPTATQARKAIEQAIRHYDYSKLNLSVFFLAECAFEAMPATP
jgi:hypothetical protein